eukprot:1161001-Pelagomonas_calceolata.AAC.12
MLNPLYESLLGHIEGYRVPPIPLQRSISRAVRPLHNLSRPQQMQGEHEKEQVGEASEATLRNGRASPDTEVALACSAWGHVRIFLSGPCFVHACMHAYSAECAPC